MDCVRAPHIPQKTFFLAIVQPTGNSSLLVLRRNLAGQVISVRSPRHASDQSVDLILGESFAC